MSPSPPVLAAGAALATTPLLAVWARRRGWIDRREGAEAARKPRVEPVPTVGGVAIAIALGLSLGVAQLSGVAWPAAVPWLAFTLALGVGAWDDVRPLPPGPKALAQLGIAGVLALEASGLGADPLACLALAGAALVAINALNTWDHADGFAGSCAAAGLWGSPAGAACLGFLPWNTALRRRRGSESVPVAYLGDGGSHALGVLLAAQPSSWPVLLVPLVDLARVVVLRLAAGQGPWVGDRRHLGQRLERGGWPPVGAACAAAGCVLPAAVLGARGALAGVFLYVVLLVITREDTGAHDRAGDDACEGTFPER